MSEILVSPNMSALKDLRELVNVSRLTFREDSDQDDKSPISSARSSIPKTLTEPDNRKLPTLSHAEPKSRPKNISKPASSKTQIESARSSLVLTDRSDLLDRNAVPQVLDRLNKPGDPEVIRWCYKPITCWIIDYFGSRKARKVVKRPQTGWKTRSLHLKIHHPRLARGRNHHHRSGPWTGISTIC